MDRKARETTVKNAFRVARPNLIEGRNILLVDDVLTSGSTASVCADVLKEKRCGNRQCPDDRTRRVMTRIEPLRCVEPREQERSPFSPQGL